MKENNEENLEDIKIEYTEEFEKQRRQAILDTEKYVKAEIIISAENPEIPFCNLLFKHVGIREIATLYICLNSLREDIEKQYPMAALYSELFLDEDKSKARRLRTDKNGEEELIEPEDIKREEKENPIEAFKHILDIIASDEKDKNVEE